MASSKKTHTHTLATCSRSKDQAEAKEDRAINTHIMALMKLPVHTGQTEELNNNSARMQHITSIIYPQRHYLDYTEDVILQQQNGSSELAETNKME